MNTKIEPQAFSCNSPWHDFITIPFTKPEMKSQINIQPFTKGAFRLFIEYAENIE